MSCYALIDCNNFFVSCERLFRPDLADKPVAVLSNNDGCIVARSNEIKALGIPMGVPLFKVRDIVKANRAVLFSANFELYGDISQRIVQLLREETPLIEVYSIDENFIDLSELPIRDRKAWAKRVRDRILKEIGVPTSVGVAPTKTLAKVASTFAKTHGDGTWVVESDEERQAMLRELPIEDIWGVGWRLAPRLKDRGVSWAAQLTDASDAWLRTQFNVTGMRMVDELRGIPRLPFGDKAEQRKTIMRSRSFGHTVRDYFQLESAVAAFATQAAARLRTQDSVCDGLTIMLQLASRDTGRKRYISRHVKLPEPTAHTGQLIASSLEGLAALYDVEGAYKKAGVTLTGIVDRSAWQLSLLHQEHDERERGVVLMQSVDTLNRRFGRGTIWHATEAKRHAQWQSKRERQSPRYTTNLTDLPRLHR
ncbi:MAG TPA: Y-family DNA polymerase [Candidatus Saccharibacteria bacterium]|nr:Y-family DNA polymerase [Candidatus Saccharibacteria bacterium]